MMSHATPATEFAPLSPLRAALTTRNTTRPKCCACHGKWHRRCPKCCACHEKCNTSSENLAKDSKSIAPATQNNFLTRCETCWNATNCHAYHAKRSDTSKKCRFCDYSHRHGNFAPTTVADGRLQTVADGCGRLRTPKAGSRKHGSTPRPPNVRRETFATHSGKTEQIIEAIVNLLGSQLKSWLLKCHAYPYSSFLTTSSPAEGKVRSLGGNCSPWRMRASSVVKFALVLMVRSVWQISEVVSMKLPHVVKQKFDTGPQDFDKLCKSNTTQNMDSLQKPGFSRKNYSRFLWLDL